MAENQCGWMPWLFTSMQKCLEHAISILALAPTVTTPTDNPNDFRESHVHLFELPNELLLKIAGSLETEFQVLLSLSCRRIRVLLASNLDLSLRDRSAKLRFLQSLEPDCPNYLICRSCAFMFKWQTRWYVDYRCPRTNRHSFADASVSYPWRMRGGRGMQVSREVVDLVLRAEERGPRYGLPSSFLGTGGTDRRSGIVRKNEARFVRGQLLLATRWELNTESREVMVSKAPYFNWAMCLHFYHNGYSKKLCRTVEQAVVKSMIGLEKSEKLRCPYCESEYELVIQNATGGRMRLVLDVWRNYGRRSGNTLAIEQVFHRENVCSRIDGDVVSRRDLHATFDSGKPDTNGSKFCRKAS